MPNIFQRRTRNAFQGPSLEIFEVAIRYVGYRSDTLDVGGCVYEVVTPSVTGAIEVSSSGQIASQNEDGCFSPNYNPMGCLCFQLN